MRRKNEGNWDKSINYVYGVWFIRYKDKIKDVVGGVGWGGVEWRVKRVCERRRMGE
jgi:hypothetical protein